MTIDRSTLSPQRIIEKYITPLVAFEPNTGCWIWMGGVYKGYARVSLPLLDSAGWAKKGVARTLHEYHVGTIPQGLELKRRCEVACCVNPEHYRAVTLRE